MNDVLLDPTQPANINYVKARHAIEESMKCRKDIRAAKLAVIEHLQGTLNHPTAAQLARGATKQVVFGDSTRARF